MAKELINTADLSKLLNETPEISATAHQIDGVEGFTLHVLHSDREFVLSTYLSSKPRLFKRADALLNEAKNIGLKSVIFPLQ